MQIVPFLTHYLLVYANFDFSSFSLISYTLKGQLLPCKRATIASPKHDNKALSNAPFSAIDS